MNTEGSSFKTYHFYYLAVNLIIKKQITIVLLN